MSASQHVNALAFVDSLVYSAGHVTLGVDPGTTVGVAAYVHSSVHSFTSIELLVDEAVRMFHTVLTLRQSTSVAVERFDVGNRFVRSTRNYDALHLTGFLRFVCGLHDDAFAQYGRSDTKALGSDRLLKSLGWYVSGAVHANDAARVLATHLLTKDDDRFRSLVRSTLREE